MKDRSIGKGDRKMRPTEWGVALDHAHSAPHRRSALRLIVAEAAAASLLVRLPACDRPQPAFQGLPLNRDPFPGLPSVRN